MNDITPEQIQARYEQQTPKMKEILSSKELLEDIQNISNRFNLMLDQTADLVDHVALVLLGFAKAGTFTEDISRRLVIPLTQAKDITNAINIEVFENIKGRLRNKDLPKEETTNTERYISEKDAIGRAGGFEIEHHPDVEMQSPQPMRSTQAERRAKVFGEPEKPAPLPPKPAALPPKPAAPQEKLPETPKTEPLVDQLLRGSTSIPQEKISKRPEPVPYTPYTPPPEPFHPNKTSTPPIQPPKPPVQGHGNDPYRESVDNK